MTQSIETWRSAGVTEAIEVTVVINMEFLDDRKILFGHGEKFDGNHWTLEFNQGEIWKLSPGACEIFG